MSIDRNNVATCVSQRREQPLRRSVRMLHRIHSAPRREPVKRMDALFKTVEWDRQHPPGQIDPAQFDYAAEDALLAAMARPVDDALAFIP